MKQIIIVGGGFAGLSAAERLRSCSKTVDVTIVDERSHSEFLPLLPDVVGRHLPGEVLRISIEQLAKKWGARFVQEHVTHIDLQSKRVECKARSFEYDGLIIAAGSETHFHGHDEFAQKMFTLGSVAEAQYLAEAVERETYTTVVVVGGGYTGVEIATHIRRRQKVLGRSTPITIVERASTPLSGLEQRFREYCGNNCRRMGIEFRLGTTVEKINEDAFVLASGEAIEHALVVWAAGVRTPAPVRDISLPQTRQGRLETDEYLRVSDGVFVAGDSAAFKKEDQLLRMGVQFSISGGWHAGENMIRHLNGRPLKLFNPWDPGYIVPMANGRGCGIPMGVFVRGRKAIALHYVMCLFRLRSMTNRFGLLRNLLGHG